VTRLRAAAPLAILLVVPLVGLAETEKPAEPKEGAVRGADLPLLETVRGIAHQVERLREQKFVRPPVAVRAPDQMRQVTAEIRMLSALRRERLEARGRAWAELGFGSASMPREAYLALCADLEGIGFDPEGNRLLVAPERLADSDFAPRKGEDDAPSTVLLMTGVRVDEPVVSHLLTHVRQRERLGGDWIADTTDGLLARAAWAEGEANVVAVRYLFGGMGLADDVLGESFDPADVLDGALLPPDLDELAPPVEALVRFVYEEGFAAAARTYRAGGWKALEREIARRGATSDLLHAGRQPREAAAVASEPPPQAKGLALADEDTLGEQGVIVLVSTVTGKDNLALQAGDGWAGDRLYRYEGEKPATAVTLWVTRWATADDAADFDYAVSRMLEARFPGKPPLTLETGERVLQTQDRIIRLTRGEREVRLQVATRDRDELPPGGS
jgi:hypothetical protein